MNHLLLALALTGALAASPPSRAVAESSKAAETKDEYVKKAHAEIDGLSGRIDGLESKGKKAGASARDGMDQKLKQLKSKRKASKRNLAKLKRASEKAWADLKAGVDAGIDDLKKAIDEAAKD